MYIEYLSPLLQARKAISLRAQMEKKVAQKEREQKEDRLRDLARLARDKRVGIHGAGDRGEGEGEGDEEDEEAAEEARERDVLRQERHKERERERRLARAHPDKRYGPFSCASSVVLLKHPDPHSSQPRQLLFEAVLDGIEPMMLCFPARSSYQPTV